MRRSARGCVLAAAMLVIGAGWCGVRETHAAEVRAARPGKTYAWNFAADTLGHNPAYSRVLGGTWVVLADSTDSARAVGATPSQDSARARTRYLRQTEDDDGVAYHYLSFTRPFLEDLDASVRFRIVAGEIDPTAGLLFQMDLKAKNGYLVRVSGKTNELVFHYLLGGRRRELHMAKIDPIEPNTWHTISITRRRSVLRATYDGREVMMVRDERFSKGTLGLWTEDDTIVDFAGFTATAR